MKIAAYARFSTNRQKKISIDDQLLVCGDLAEQVGGEIDPELIFVDKAVSGGVKGKDKCHGLNALLKVISNRDADVLVVDEVSRIARRAGQLGYFEELVEESGIRFISGDGVDSFVEGWQILFQLRAMIGAQSLRITRHWTWRSMRGRLERGYMVATPPFGYVLNRVYNDVGEKQGTVWLVDQQQAEIVKEIFKLRSQGEPLGAIAKELNERGIPTPRKARKGGPSYWRPGSIARLLNNKIYRGVFVWHGSHAIQAKAKRQKKDPGIREFERPDLRLIDDETWFTCNKKKISRNGRGGDRHPFAGLVNCGTCNSVLTVCTGGSVPSLYCAQCQQARRVSAVKRERGGYLTASGLQEVLLFAGHYLISPRVLAEFRERLKEKLTGGHDDEIARLKIDLDRVTRACERLAKMLRNLDGEEGPLFHEYQEAEVERKHLEKQLGMLESGQRAVDTKAIKKQLEMDPNDLLDNIFDRGLPAARLRALFCRIFDEIVLESKPERHVAIISVTFSPGSVAAFETDTDLIDTTQIRLRLRLSISSRNPTVWKVDLLSESSEDSRGYLPHT